jgi:hypothetical protein
LFSLLLARNPPSINRTIITGKINSYQSIMDSFLLKVERPGRFELPMLTRQLGRLM